MEPLPYYKWHWRDYRANKRVQRMGWQAKGLYRELLDEFWVEGYLPLDHAELAMICGCTLKEFEKHWPEIAPCWEESPEGLGNAKMDSMRTAIDKTRVANASNGRAGAIAKLANASDTLANAKPPLATAKRKSGARHIAEQSKAEQIQSKAESSRDKRESDPRHVPFRNEVEAYAEGKGVPFVWGPGEAKQLQLLLSAAPTFHLGEFKTCLQNRARSPSTPHGDRPQSWLPSILKYFQGPLNQFGKTGEVHGNESKGDSTTAALWRSIQAGRNQGAPGEDGYSQAGEGGRDGIRSLLGGPDGLRDGSDSGSAEPIVLEASR